MTKQKVFRITSIILGVMLYFIGFSGFFGSKEIQMGFMLLGDYLIFIPLLLLGSQIRGQKKFLGMGLIAISIFFLFVISIVTLAAFLMM